MTQKKIRCGIAGFLAISLILSITTASTSASAACSAWLDRTFLNEYYFGTNGSNFLEIFSQDPSFSASTWANWSIDVYSGNNQFTRYNASNSTAQTCSSGSKDWGVLSTGGLESSHALVILRDENGDPVDAMAFDNNAPPDPWKSSSDNYYPALATQCSTLASRLSAQASAAAGKPYSAQNMVGLSSYGNKDIARFPDGSGKWSESALSGSNTTSTKCGSNSPVLTKTATSGATVSPGGTITWRVSLSNTGNSTLSNVSITDTITGSSGAPAVTNVTTSTNCGTATFTAQGGTWSISSVAKGASCTLTVTATVPNSATNGTQYTNAVSGNIGGYSQSDSAIVTVSVSSVDHYEIDLPNVGLTCQSASIGVRACANNTSPCTSNLSTISTTTALTASSGSFTNTGGATQTFTGSAAYTLSGTAAGTVSVSMSAPVGATVRCYNFDGTTRSPSASCSYQANSAAFLFDVPNFKSGDGSGSVTVTALQSNNTNTKCVPFVPTGGIKFWTTYSNPNSGSKSVSMTAGNTSYTLPTSKPANGNVSLTFDSNGQSSFALNYLDAGLMRLDAEWNSVTGNDSFVVKPYFVISGLTCADGTANPAANSSTGGKFCRAGQNFSATVSAVAKDGTTSTPNFGRESTAEGARLTASLVSPTGAGVVAPALSGSFGSFADVGTARQASGSSFSWGEVGIIQLTPGIADGDYLGAGDVTENVVPYVGRFYPDHLETTVTPACSAAFTYSGQPFALRVAAYRAGGSGTTGMTSNYDGVLGFSKNVTISATGATGSITGGDAPSQPSQFLASHFNSGATPLLSASSVLNPVFAFGTSPSAAATISVRATDSDNVSSSGASEGAMAVRSGRLTLNNAYGSELLALPVPIRTEYWTGSAWARNTLDSCTQLVIPTSANGGLLFGPQVPNRNQLAAGESNASLSSPIASGNANLLLSAPGQDNYGYVDVVGAVLRGTNSWLALPTARARACFGSCGPRSQVIYQRENY